MNTRLTNHQAKSKESGAIDNSMAIKYFMANVRVGGNITANDKKFDLSFPKDARVVDTNILYDDSIGLVVVPATLWLIELMSVPTFEHENNDTATKGLRSYFQFLSDHKLEWDIFPRTKIERPTYAFKRYMISKVKLGEYSYSTGNQFLGVVKRFYLWANQEGLIDFNKIHAPFLIDRHEVNTHTRVGKKRFSVSTSDMKLPKKLKNTPRTNGPRELTPLNTEVRKHLAIGLRTTNKEHFTLSCQLSLLSGLREEEALTLPYDEFIGDKSIRRLLKKETVTLRIGGNDGTKTKNGVARDIDIPYMLYERLCNYASSEKRLRLVSDDKNEEQRLFLSNRGTPFKPDELTKRMSELRALLSQKHNIELDHKYHDLRCTYATEYGSRLLDSGMDYTAAFNELKSRLGHSLDKDTARYMRIIESRKIKRQSAIELEKYTQEVLLSDD